MRLGHDGPVDLRKRLVLVVIPELFNICLDPLIECDRGTGLQANPTRIHLHFFVARNRPVIGTIDCLDGKLVSEKFRSRCIEGVYAISWPFCRAGKFRKRNLTERNGKITRQHFIHGVEFVYPAGWREHSTQAGCVFILPELDFERGCSFAY